MLAHAGGANSAEPVRQAFDLQVMNPPAAAHSPAGAQFVYELHVTNFARDALTLVAVEALDAATGKVVGELGGEALEAALGRPDLGGGRYAFYEHLAEGVRVKAGDRVKEGDVIGALGATGHVTSAHLHFHVADANVPLAAEGLPYALTNFRPLGAYDSIEALRDGEAWEAFPADELEPGFSFPSPMMVVEFADAED